MIIVYSLLLMQYGRAENYYLDNILNNSKTVSGAVWYPIQCKIDAKKPRLIAIKKRLIIPKP